MQTQYWLQFYKKNDQIEFKHKFDSCESIENNYSGGYQDLFVLTMLNGKKNGTYLDIGANDAIKESNTYLLEKNYNWKGVSIDIIDYSESFKKYRSNPFVLADALKIDYKSLLNRIGFERQIDYLSLDIDPSIQTLRCLQKLPLNDFRFSVITFETDYYNKSNGWDIAEKVKFESRKIFQSYGYEMIVGNIGQYEDWYVDPTVVDKKIIEQMKGSAECTFYPDSFLVRKKDSIE